MGNVELPRLKTNPSVTKITIIDPKTQVETIIFGSLEPASKQGAEGGLFQASLEVTGKKRLIAAEKTTG